MFGRFCKYQSVFWTSDPKVPGLDSHDLYLMVRYRRVALFKNHTHRDRERERDTEIVGWISQ